MKKCEKCEWYRRSLVEAAVRTNCRITFDIVMRGLKLKNVNELYKLAKRMKVEK